MVEEDSPYDDELEHAAESVHFIGFSGDGTLEAWLLSHHTKKSHPHWVALLSG